MDTIASANFRQETGSEWNLLHARTLTPIVARTLTPIVAACEFHSDPISPSASANPTLTQSPRLENPISPCSKPLLAGQISQRDKIFRRDPGPVFNADRTGELFEVTNQLVYEL